MTSLNHAEQYVILSSKLNIDAVRFGQRNLSFEFGYCFERYLHSKVKWLTTCRTYNWTTKITINLLHVNSNAVCTNLLHNGKLHDVSCINDAIHLLTQKVARQLKFKESFVTLQYLRYNTKRLFGVWAGLGWRTLEVPDWIGDFVLGDGCFLWCVTYIK